MKLHRIKHALLRLSPEEKVIGIGGLAVIIGAFLPWYTVVYSYDKDPVIESGFSGDLGVMGFVVFLLVLIALLFLLGENMHIRLPDFGHKKENLMMFLMAQSAFLILLTITIYTKRSFEYTNAELRFGIYLALVGACLGTFAAFAQVQKENKAEVEAFFDHSEDDELKTTKKTKDEEYDVEEEAEVEKPTQMAFDASKEDEKASEDEDIKEDDIVENVSITEESADQGNYFMREAGVRAEVEVKKQVMQEPVDEKPEEPQEEEDKSEEASQDQNDNKPPRKDQMNLGMNFYED